MLAIRNYWTILISLLTAILIACSFPNKATSKNIQEINQELSILKPLILSEFKSDTTFFQTYKVRNDSLKSYFLKHGITELSINYSVNPKVEQQTDLLSLDSSIILQKNKSKNDRFVYQYIVYYFGSSKPRGSFNILAPVKMKQINDSVWFVRSDRELIFIY